MKRIFTFAFTALVALMSFAPNTATAQTTEPLDTVELRFKSFLEDQPFFQAADTSIARQTGDTIITPANWTITLENDRYQFDFIIFNSNAYDPSGTYTEKDLDIPFSKVMIPEANGKTSYIKTGNIVLRKEQISTSYFKYILDATIVSTLGIGGEVNGIFKIHAEHKVIEPSARYDIALYNCVVTPEEDRFNIAGQDDTIAVDMTFFTELGIEGYYSHNLLDTENSKIVHRGTAYDVMELEGIITAAENIYGSVTYVAMMEILANSETDTTFFNVAMEAPIVPIDTVNIFCSNLIMTASQDAVVIDASNNDYSIYAGYNDFVIRDSASYVGTSTQSNAMVYITERKTEKVIDALVSKIDVVGSKTKGYLVTAKVVGDDHNYYDITLTNVLPDKMDTVNVDFPANSNAAYDIDELGLHELYLANYNGEYSVSFDILNIDRILLQEEFTKSDLFIDKDEVTTYFVKHTDDGDVPVDFVQFEGEIKQKNDSTFLKAILIGFDSTVYNISMYYTVPTPTDTISYTFNENNTFFTNALPQGIFILEGMTDDGQAMCNIQVNRITTGSPEGTFICDGKFEENQFEPFETYVSILKDPAKQEYETHYMQKGEMTVTIDKEKLLVVATASFICDDAILYQLSLTAPYEIPHLPEDAEDEGASYTFGRNTEVFVMDDYLESDGYIEYILYVENPFNMLDLIFFIDETDPDIIIPEGVYPFGAYGSKNHVLASRGMAQDSQTGEIYPLPSYYQTLDELSQPYGYFLVAGQVTVEKVDGHIVLNVDAINSNYLPVKILYDPSITAVENIETDSVTSVQKQIINGQLFIIRNGETFSITGMRVK